MSQPTPFVVLGQYLKDMSFENPYINEIAKKKDMAESRVNFDADTSFKIVDEKERIYETQLKVHAHTAVPDQNQKLFIIEVVYCGLVQINKDCPKEQIEPILLVDVPFYLFFELRNVIAQITWQGGYTPLFLQPIDFFGLYKKKQEQVTQ